MHIETYKQTETGRKKALRTDRYITDGQKGRHTHIQTGTSVSV